MARSHNRFMEKAPAGASAKRRGCTEVAADIGEGHLSGRVFRPRTSAITGDGKVARAVIARGVDRITEQQQAIHAGRSSQAARSRESAGVPLSIQKESLFEHERIIPQERQRPCNAAPCIEDGIALVRDDRGRRRDRGAPRRDLIGEIMRVDDGLRRLRRAQALEVVGNDGLSHHGDERLPGECW